MEGSYLCDNIIVSKIKLQKICAPNYLGVLKSEEYN